MKVNRNKLYLAMARKCMDTKDLVEKTGLPRPTINNAIVGKAVRPSTIGIISKALVVDVTDILEQE